MHQGAPKSNQIMHISVAGESMLSLIHCFSAESQTDAAVTT